MAGASFVVRLEEDGTSSAAEYRCLKIEQRENNKSGEEFVFLDGPPYANGKLHMGASRQTRLDAKTG